MGIKEQILEDFKEAMKAGDKERKQTLKMLKAAVQNEEIKTGEDLDEPAVREILAKQARQRKEAIEEYKEGGRDELVAKEKKELEIIDAYLPDSLSEAELEELVDEVVEEVAAEDMSDMGDVMSNIMPRVRGRAEGEEVNRLVRSKLGG